MLAVGIGVRWRWEQFEIHFAPFHWRLIAAQDDGVAYLALGPIAMMASSFKRHPQVFAPALLLFGHAGSRALELRFLPTSWYWRAKTQFLGLGPFRLSWLSQSYRLHWLQARG